MRKTLICPGVSYLEIPEARFSVLCGCPENVIKLLFKAGLIQETEREGVRFETGPNAILLSENPIQAGRFSNLGEFPVLQMLYRQGMLIPRHPNNSGLKPMIIGLREQVEAQARYIYLGNYGLSSTQELEAAGLSPELAREQLRMKLRFAFGHIRKTEEILDLRIIDGNALALRDGIFIHRLGSNRYEFIHAGKSEEVDLNLGQGEGYSSPYTIPEIRLARDDFAVVHIGEGDGWDPERPCMSSLIIHDGEPYLVDAGPNIEESLSAMGLKARDLRGIFQTHVHDDHFVGLTALLGSDRRIPFFSVPCVRHTVERKLGALCGFGEQDFHRFFEVRDLVEGEWNRIEGLEVQPLLAPHPVENTIMRFRAPSGDSWKTYAHLADLTSFAVLDSMIEEDPEAPGVSRDYAGRIKAAYLLPADLKKIDAGGGMIHGEAQDFRGDRSGKVYASHTDSTEKGNATGLPVAAFGETCVLVPGRALEKKVPGGMGRVSVSVMEALLRSGLFDERIGEERLHSIAAQTRAVRYAEGAAIAQEDSAALFIVRSGRAILRSAGRPLAVLAEGDSFGEERILCDQCCLFEARADGEVEGLLIPATLIMDCPILLWRLKERHERRLAALKSVFRFEWRAEYSVGNELVDGQHRHLFSLLGALAADYSNQGCCDNAPERFRELIDFAAEHFSTEERLMRSWAFPGLADQEQEHRDLMKDAERYLEVVECGDPEAEASLVDFLKGWLLKHTLLVDRLYMPFMGS